jgi:hypothetical protein
MRTEYRARQLANLVNGSTVTGLLVAMAGRARPRSGPNGLIVATVYRLPVPAADAFCVGNVVVTRLGFASLTGNAPLLAHEARHATQYACLGLPMIPAYLGAAAFSWLLTGSFGARNTFERRAGLADGGYAEAELRPGLRRALPGLRRALPGLRRALPRLPGLSRLPGPPQPATSAPAGLAAPQPRLGRTGSTGVTA